ncbi:hypothetical protein HYV50_03590 [Candidatus Pacearchaeota archaeon]|nr:hypothetical protein [Candidatus Pacearchaeota archaeon]
MIKYKEVSEVINKYFPNYRKELMEEAERLETMLKERREHVIGDRTVEEIRNRLSGIRMKLDCE